ncbi:heavy metal-associated isoprenylated plant protein 47-like [Oryza brachyantha]|uniref:HMA domain-containing protein n=1 Tax=Oryza brachyantha TaxID=4533 RepID=J3L8M3_ORYBR|nr:heavy metal-associated isoprenylated plant protein 47-like [Oryza brachyantha]
MQQKIVIKVSMPCGKCRSKVMALVAAASGVNSVRVAGDGTDRLEVVGDGVDPVCIANRIRRKIGYAEIVQVEEVKEKKSVPPMPVPAMPLPPELCYGYPLPCYQHHHPPPPVYVYGEQPGGSCPIM